MSLSDKRFPNKIAGKDYYFYFEEDVKEFIETILEKIDKITMKNKSRTIIRNKIFKVIEESAGDNLI